jgi:hypothetical protein
LDWCIEQSQDSELRIEQAEKDILQMLKPHVWNIYEDGNMEIEMEVEFEKFLIAVSQHINTDIDDIKTFRFYSLVTYLKEKYPKK